MTKTPETPHDAQVERVAKAIFVKDSPSDRIKGRWAEVSEPMRDDYRSCARVAIAALPAPDVAVKPLVWSGEFHDEADTPWGSYNIQDRRAGPDEDYEWFGWSFTSRGDWDESEESWATKDQAQAAAQADYMQRILSALDMTTPPVSVGEAADRLASWLEASLKCKAHIWDDDQRSIAIIDLAVYRNAAAESIRSLTEGDA